MTKKWYYTYDEEKYFSGAVLSETCPESATAISPEGIIDKPQYDESSDKWLGKSITEYQPMKDDDSNLDINNLISRLLQGISADKLRQEKVNAGLLQQNAIILNKIAEIKVEKETING
ncbi:hypothetical protein LNP18_03310 [Leuconostoc citreum]|uniref:hypothetical protein n=1 Tax=Leuconostoc citreum TaxID=33964 RepID=UPI00200B6CE3|nr:hypothetical protein [Leuconostoc citreum]MCK8605127.1 hypothetical protein [Leuconostoc citreum]